TLVTESLSGRRDHSGGLGSVMAPELWHRQSGLGAPSMTRRRYNLCLFTNRFGHGGTEHQFAELVSRLDQSKYNLEVACFSRTGEFLDRGTSAGLRVDGVFRGLWFASSTAS